jgi:hypothetical protein
MESCHEFGEGNHVVFEKGCAFATVATKITKKIGRTISEAVFEPGLLSLCAACVDNDNQGNET